MKLNLESLKETKGDLLPLMDCMFILLIYFIFSMLDMTTYPGIKVNSPDAFTSNKSTDPFNTITVMEDGIYVNKKPVTMDTLEDELQALSIEDMTAEGKKLHLAADKETDAQLVFKVMEKLRVIGEKKIYIETNSKSQSPADGVGE